MANDLWLPVWDEDAQEWCDNRGLSSSAREERRKRMDLDQQYSQSAEEDAMIDLYEELDLDLQTLGETERMAEYYDDLDNVENLKRDAEIRDGVKEEDL